MNKTIILYIIAASLALTSCNENIPSENEYRKSSEEINFSKKINEKLNKAEIKDTDEYEATENQDLPTIDSSGETATNINFSNTGMNNSSTSTGSGN